MNEPAVQAPDWEATPLKSTDLATKLEQWEDAKSRTKLYQEQAEVLGLQIRALLEQHHVDMVRCGRYQPRLFTSHKPKRLSTDKLLELGVRQSVISKATTGGEEYTTFRIFDLGEPE